MQRQAFLLNRGVIGGDEVNVILAPTSFLLTSDHVSEMAVTNLRDIDSELLGCIKQVATQTEVDGALVPTMWMAWRIFMCTKGCT